MTDEEAKVVIELLGVIKNLQEQLTTTQAEYVTSMNEDSVVFGQTIDMVNALNWVVRRFVPPAEVEAWIERGKIAVLEQAFLESGNNSTPNLGLD